MTIWSLRNLRRKLKAMAITDATQVTSSNVSATYVGTGYTDVKFPNSAYCLASFVNSA